MPLLDVMCGSLRLSFLTELIQLKMARCVHLGGTTTKQHAPTVKVGAENALFEVGARLE